MTKILLYNILDGCQDETRFNLLVKFVNKESPDILALLELNHWNDDNFKILNNFKSLTGYEYHAFLETKTGYNIAVFSKVSFELVRHYIEKFHHGLLKVRVDDVELLITHLNPFDSTLRLVEVEEILSLTSPDQKTIILGDLNSLSPHDGYDENEVIQYMERKRIIKFGSGKIEYTSIDLLENHDFFDAYLLKNKTFKHSVPTPSNSDDAHFMKLRLDYFFVNSALKPLIDKIQIIQNNDTDQISDHYPIVLFLSEDQSKDL